MGNNNGVPVLSEDNVKSLVITTGLSAEEVKIGFEQFVLNHPTGYLTRKDFTAMIQKLLPRKAAATMADHLFRIYDKDRNGKIGFEEFLSVYQIMENGTPEQILGQIFNTFDVSQDGNVNAKDMKKVVKDMMVLIKVDDNLKNSIADVIARNAFKEMDKNCNGKITAQDFVTACLEQDSYSKMLALKIMDVFIDK